MKRISMLLVAATLFSVSNLRSQVPTAGATTTGPNYDALTKKVTASDADIINEKKNTKAKTWTSRVDALVDVYNVYNDVLQRGINKLIAKGIMKDPKEVQTMKDGSDVIEILVYERVNLKFRNDVLEGWTETKSLYPDPLGEACKALNKAVELNTDSKADADIAKSGTALKTALADAGSVAYENKDYKGAYEAFNKIIPIADLSQIKALADTMDNYYIYFAGRSALDNQDYKEASRLFSLATSRNFDSPFIYVYSKQAYFGLGDTAAGVDVIKKGFQKYPSNQSIMIELINYYLLSNKTDDALQLIAVAKAGDPTNPSYAFTEGTLLDKAGRFPEAEARYKEAISMNANYFDANYNLAVLYYNQAVKMYDEAARTVDVNEANKIQEQGNQILAKAIPYMEKSSEIDPGERSTYTVLRQIYYRLKDSNPALEQKFNDVVKKLSEM